MLGRRRGRRAALCTDWFRPLTQRSRRLLRTPNPVLWPEHFDLGVTLDEVNYGVSLGDEFHAAPVRVCRPVEAA